jgi:hypothetical protein
VILLKPRARAHRIGNSLTRIDDQVLDLRQYASLYVRVAVAGHAATGRAKPGKIVLARVYIAPTAVAASVTEKVGFERHLKKGIVPPNAPLLAMMLVPVSYIAEFWRQPSIAPFKKRHQAVRRHALRDRVIR